LLLLAFTVSTDLAVCWLCHCNRIHLLLLLLRQHWR